MKKLTLKDLVGGLELVNVSMVFSTTSGYFQEQYTAKVKKTSHVVAREGCDVIIGGYSCNSQNVYEIGGISGVSGIGVCAFSIRNWGESKLSFYCLPENCEKAIEEVKAEFAGSLTILAEELHQEAEAIREFTQQRGEIL